MRRRQPVGQLEPGQGLGRSRRPRGDACAMHECLGRWRLVAAGGGRAGEDAAGVRRLASNPLRFCGLFQSPRSRHASDIRRSDVFLLLDVGRARACRLHTPDVAQPSDLVSARVCSLCLCGRARAHWGFQYRAHAHSRDLWRRRGCGRDGVRRAAGGGDAARTRLRLALTPPLPTAPLHHPPLNAARAVLRLPKRAVACRRGCVGRQDGGEFCAALALASRPCLARPRFFSAPPARLWVVWGFGFWDTG